MYRYLVLFALILLYGDVETSPTLEDFWEGQAEWVLELEDVGLPVGESDTIIISGNNLRSYVHASDRSVGMIDQCGDPVAFPGCLTHYESTDSGMNFFQSVQICGIPCDSCPCQDMRDHQGYRDDGNRYAAQQYPRVMVAEDGIYYMVYEWHAQTIIRRSTDGLNWADWSYLVVPGGTWPLAYAPCSDIERVGEHPFISVPTYDCLVGAPPGLFVEGDMLYVFVDAGESPGHMRCYKGNRYSENLKLQLCDTDPLFSSASTYGDIELNGADANPYFDFRYVSSADVIKVGDHYYMTYEGIRGPDASRPGDAQFGLGFARSIGSEIDGKWEKFPHNPIIKDVSFDFGIGHADLIIIAGVTYMYTATSETTRGRFVLRWKATE